MDSDPIQVLERLRTILDESGIIKSTVEAASLAHVSSRGMITTVLRATALHSEARCNETITRFLTEGGWAVLGEWFQQSLESKHITILIDIIEVFKFPCSDAFRITDNLRNAAKLESKPLQIVSKRLLIKWKKLVRDAEQEKIKKISEKRENNKKSTTFLDSLSAAISNDKCRKRRITTEIPEKKIIPKISEELKEPETLVQKESEQDPVDVSTNENIQRRRVRFRDDSLVETFYFEMTEQERLEMHGERPSLKFDEARQLECLEEKNALKQAKNYLDENEFTKETVLIDDSIEFPRGENSLEKVNQEKRESNILPPLYVKETQIPDSSTDPPLEDSASTNELEIPPLDSKPEVFFNYNLLRVFCIPYWEKYRFPILPPPAPHHPQSFKPRDFVPHPPRPHYPYIPPLHSSERPPFKRGRPRHFHALPVKYLRPFKAFQSHERVYRAKYPNQDQPLPPRHDNTGRSFRFTSQNKILCRHFLKGNCQMGNSCKFSHEPSELP